ncbi:hypothetical protein ACFY40_05320 [Streptomyces sp. NPDC012950]|uniref:hypothetical protein n=1 Tax=Streptomyces sp. NPDC012950 TaxID=3364858 RepID=UPI003673DB14
MSAGLLVAVLLASALLEGSGWAGGVGDGNLRLTVTVNGRADSDVRPPEVRVGTWVVKRYRLLNVSEADLHRVRVLDPGAPAGSVRCPAVLPAAEEAECTARFRAVAGRHVHPVRAEGDVPSPRTRLTATARAGYAGVAGALGLTEEVVVATPGTGGGGASATVTYTVTNRGNLPLHAVRVEDPGLALAPGAPDCGGGGGTVAVLAPDTSAFCRATVRLRPGTYRSTGRASGSDRATTLGAGGERVTAPVLTAGTSTVFVVREAPAAPAAGAGAVGASGAGAPVPEAPAAAAPGAGAPASGAPGAGAPAAPAPGASGTGAAPAPGAPGALADTGTGAGTGAGTEAAGRPVAPAAPGAGAAPGAVPPGAVPPGAVPPSSVSPGAVPPAPPPGLRRAAGLDDEGFLGRVRRRGREAAEFGVATMLLLLLIPAAVAAALLGSRRK